MWELDYIESWAPKNWCFWTVGLEKTLERPLECKEIQPVNPKGNQSWIFIGRTDTNAEVSIVWPPEAKCQLIRKDPDAGKDWMQEEKGMTEDEMVGWHHQLNGHEFEWAPGSGEGQGSWVHCRPCGSKESDTTEWLKNNKTLGSLQVGPCLFCDYYCMHLLFCLEHKYLFTVCVRSTIQSCPALWNPMNCILPGSSVYGIFQARIPELVANSYSRRSPWRSNLHLLCLLYWRVDSLPLYHLRSPQFIESNYSNKKRHNSIHCAHAYNCKQKCSILQFFMYYQVPG